MNMILGCSSSECAWPRTSWAIRIITARATVITAAPDVIIAYYKNYKEVHHAHPSRGAVARLSPTPVECPITLCPGGRRAGAEILRQRTGHADQCHPGGSPSR